jgi:hypothetical protein
MHGQHFRLGFTTMRKQVSTFDIWVQPRKLIGERAGVMGRRPLLHRVSLLTRGEDEINFALEEVPDAIRTNR